MSTQTFQVAGMTCSHCIAAVTEEIAAVAPGIRVDVQLGDPSIVTMSGEGLPDAEQIAEALDEAGGYTLVPGSLG